jgi:hypothetical protein
MAKRTLVENGRQTYKKQPRANFVRVAGRYRVGELLGSGGSGESNSDFSSTHSSEPLKRVFI